MFDNPVHRELDALEATIAEIKQILNELRTAHAQGELPMTDTEAQAIRDKVEHATQMLTQVTEMATGAVARIYGDSAPA